MIQKLTAVYDDRQKLGQIIVLREIEGIDPLQQNERRGNDTETERGPSPGYDLILLPGRAGPWVTFFRATLRPARRRV